MLQSMRLTRARRPEVMPSDLVIFYESTSARYMIAGWKPQWSDGGEISSGLPQYLVEKLGARKIG